MRGLGCTGGGLKGTKGMRLWSCTVGMEGWEIEGVGMLVLVLGLGLRSALVWC